MQLHEITELKEALDVQQANHYLQHGWQLVAAVPRGAVTVYVMGRKQLHGMAAAIANARTLQPVSEPDSN